MRSASCTSRCRRHANGAPSTRPADGDTPPPTDRRRRRTSGRLSLSTLIGSPEQRRPTRSAPRPRPRPSRGELGDDVGDLHTAMTHEVVDAHPHRRLQQPLLSIDEPETLLVVQVTDRHRQRIDMTRPRPRHVSRHVRTTRTGRTPRPATGPAGSHAPTTRDPCPSTPPAPTDPDPPAPTSGAHNARRTNRANFVTHETVSTSRRPRHDPPHRHQPRATPRGCRPSSPSSSPRCSPPTRGTTGRSNRRRNQPKPVLTTIEKGCDSGEAVSRSSSGVVRPFTPGGRRGRQAGLRTGPPIAVDDP